MSLEVWVAVLHAEISDAPKKAVLSGLANHAGPDGRHAYPSVLRLSVYSGLTDRTVTRILGELVADGLVSIVRQGGGRGHPTEYAIDLARLAQMRSTRLDALDVAVVAYRERVTENQGSLDQRVTPAQERVTATRERVTATTLNPVTESPEPYLTVHNHQDEPSRELAASSPPSKDQTPWIQVLAVLRLGMSRAEFDSWVRDTELVSLSPSTLVLGVANAYAADRLRSRHLPEIEAAALHVLGHAVTVTVTVLHLGAGG